MRGLFLSPLPGSVPFVGCSLVPWLLVGSSLGVLAKMKKQKEKGVSIGSSLLHHFLTPAKTHTPALTPQPPKFGKGLQLPPGGPASVALSPLPLLVPLSWRLSASQRLVQSSKPGHTSVYSLSSLKSNRTF